MFCYWIQFDKDGSCGVKMKPLMGIVCTVMLFIVYRTTNYQYQQTEVNISSPHNLLAIPVGIKQKSNVDAIVQKILGNHEVRRPGDISAGFRPKFDWYTSQDYDKEKNKEVPQVCRRNGSCVLKSCLALCLASYSGPASLICQNDLVHGWGMDMKLGYCAQGDRTKKVGIIDSEYIVHQSIQTLGGTSTRKASDPEKSVKKHAVDVRSEIRRQSTSELQTFKERWERAAEEDKNWVDPFRRKRRRKQRRSQRLNV
ncbi:hypothetical protein RJ640_030170 [Escallonia rubra]|uniref:Uncharacterized protein n=1 Tax=Escallonia rubra TaxID=112253 RepID=A0AA88QSM8_9ASTE|nr:hypothetical protein RJ640_030170 [Escallonia rubra]